MALARAWRDLGAHVTVIAPEGADDDDLIGVRHPSFPATPDLNASRHINHEPLGSRLRHALLLPDPEVRWSLRAAEAAVHAANKADWIVTTSPPESLHLAGYLLKRRTQKLWLADIRDLWLDSPQLAARRNPVRRYIESVAAKWMLSNCDLISTVSPELVREARTFAGSDTPIEIVPHFAASYDGPAERLPEATFNIVHTGSISLSNPLSQFQCLLHDFEALVEQRPQTALWLAGHLSSQEVEAIESSVARPKVHILGPVSMDRARALQLGGDALAIVSGSNSHALPGKFAEYAATGHPILLSAPGPWCDLIPSNVTTLPFSQAVTLPKAGQNDSMYKSNSSQPSPAQALLDAMTRLHRIRS